MNILIKVLGTGCTKCKQTTEVIQQVVNENKLKIEIEKVEDIMKIMEYNVMSTPAVVINDEVVIKGRVPSKEEIKEILLANKTIEDLDKPSEGCCSNNTCC
ncbi:thioredoxin family protein [uncultured Lutibacter sp.]|uniref:thioredoxin family protein n=1 Tax=uncultured Lutibacter sp. TaxID=437739 RepID=UPI002632F4D5|nr:thioredoxin family protein [uncultured Lutibacter sp.]